MALPLKSGADLYNQQAIRMRLHNLGADPSEVGMGLIYFNTNTDTQGSNHSLHPCVYNGTSFKALAYVDDVANNAEFKALQDDVKLLKGDVDTDTLINNLKDLEEFLKGYDESDKLQSLLDGKLDKSGGTINGSLQIVNDTGAINYYNSNLNQTGWLFYGGGSNWYVTNHGWQNNFLLLHSGNIGEYKAGGLEAFKVTDVNDAASGKLFYGKDASNMPATSYVAGFTFPQGDLGYKFQLAFDFNGNLYSRKYGGSWQSWKTIAFTDSTVAAAKKLVDASGDDAVTIGANKELIAKAAIILGNSKSLAVTSTDNTQVAALYMDGNNNLLIGKGTNTKSAGIYMYGSQFFLKTGTSETNSLIINSSGNVTIGGSDQSTYKLYVAGTSYIDGNIYGNIANLKTIELTDSTPYIDFHYGNSTSDYTSRIVEDAEGRLALNSLLYVNKGGNVLIGTTNDDNSGAKLQVNGGISIPSNNKIVGIGTDKSAYSLVRLSDTNEFIVGDNRVITQVRSSMLRLSCGSSNTIGILMNSSGNVTIGSEDKAGTSYKLYVNGGKTFVSAWNSAAMSLGTAQPNSLLIGDTNNGLGIWYQYLVGSVIQAEMFNGEAKAENLALNPLGGNVLIASAPDAEARLGVNGRINAFNGLSAGSATINSDLYNIVIAPKQNRIATVGHYYGGIAFNHSLRYGGSADYDNTAHAWIGTRLVDATGSEYDALVFAVKGTGTSTTPPSERMCILPSGNVGIGTTEPKVPLDVMGSVMFGKSNSCNVYLRRNGTNYINAGFNDTEAPNASIAFTTGGKGSSNIALLLSNTLATLYRNTTIEGDLHVKGNIIADKEVSAGGAGEEGGSSSGGSGAFDTTTLTKGQSSYNVAHNLGTDNVIICIYEKSTSGTWEMILTDVEITDANNIKVTFGSATSVDHKVVIMGAVA